MPTLTSHLDALAATGGAFVAEHEPALKRWRADGGTDARAFVDYMTALTQWRRLPYLDPGLPPELLPAGWNGGRAADLFGDLDALLRAPAREHALTAIHA